MWTRRGKQISAEEAIRIRKIHKRMEFLDNVDDNGFLLKDISPSDMCWADKNEFLKLLLLKNIGPILNRKYELTYFPENKLFYLARTSETETKEIDFEISMNRDPLSIEESKIYIGLRDRENNLVPCTLNPQGAGSHKNILTLAIYFYNKYSTYQKIKETLIEKKDILTKRIGETYTNDIIALFSARKPENKIENFFIPVENIIKNNYYQEMISIIGEDIAKAKIHFFSGPVIASSRIYLSLTEENIIYFDTSGSGTKELGKTNFEEFITNQTNNWLKELEEMTDFGLAIYNEIKAKIVLDKII